MNYTMKLIVKRAVEKVLRNKGESKAVKSARGSALSMPYLEKRNKEKATALRLEALDDYLSRGGTVRKSETEIAGMRDDVT